MDGADAVGSFVMCSTIPWKMAVPHGIDVQILADVSVTLRVVLGRSVVTSASFFTSGVWLEQHFRATETFGANSVEVFVWELASLLLVN